MNGILIIIRKEWRTFAGSDRGMFLLYAILIVSWSFMLANPSTGPVETGPLWLVFFSVVISANFSNTVFISERLNGNLEILLTSGIARKHILFGKMIFIAGISTLIGLVCIAFSSFLRSAVFHTTGSSTGPAEVLLYCCAVFMNTAGSAWLSVFMSNPRLLHLANLFTLALLITAYMVISAYLPLPPETLSAVLVLLGIGATIFAVRLYESEKILQPVNL
ncbi:MAG: hypothetical protein JW863_10070 [Chitinispirillaceae bacterium]|nr:hypothetical protein [Chitinispirillaceae bacterium]